MKKYHESCYEKHMRRFGCTAYLLKKGGNKKKFDIKTIKGIFMGYNENNTYWIYIPETKNIKCDCDAKFDEDKNGSDLLRYGEDNNDKDEKPISINLDVENVDKDNNEVTEEEIGEERELRTEMNEKISEEEDSDYEDARIKFLNNEDRKEENNENQEVNTEQEEPTTSRKIGRPKNLTKEAIIVDKSLRKQEQEKLDEQRNVRRSTRIRNQSAMISVDEKMPTVTEAAKQSPEWGKWREAMKGELESLQRHQGFSEWTQE